MNNSEFKNTINLLQEHKNSVALINIKEFKNLQRIKGEYKWLPLEIENLPAIPIKTVDFKECFREANEILKIRLTPVWQFLTNNKNVITPNIETFEFTVHNKYKPHYTLYRNIIRNPKYLTSGNIVQLLEKEIAQKENAIQWDKKTTSTLLSITDPLFLNYYLEKYQNELEQFNQIYENSAKIAEELRGFQKKLK